MPKRVIPNDAQQQQDASSSDTATSRPKPRGRFHSIAGMTWRVASFKLLDSYSYGIALAEKGKRTLSGRLLPSHAIGTAAVKQVRSTPSTEA